MCVSRSSTQSSLPGCPACLLHIVVPMPGVDPLATWVKWSENDWKSVCVQYVLSQTWSPTDYALWGVIWRWYQWGDCRDERIFVKFYNQCPNKHLLNHLYFSYNCKCKWLFCETFLLMLVWKQQQCTQCYCSVQLYIYFQYGTLHYSTTLYRSGFENASLYLIYRSWLEVPW